MFDNLFLRFYVITVATKTNKSYAINEAFETAKDARKYAEKFITGEHIFSYNISEISIGDSDDCTHPESMREYGQKLYAMQTRECPAEYIEWYDCKMCGEHVNL